MNHLDLLRRTAGLFLLALLSFTAKAQTTPGHWCPSDGITDSLIANDPRWARSFFYMEQAIEAANAIPAEERTDDIYVLPVVVHVIHEGEPYGTGSNISDEQIYSAIEALNEDYRRLPGTNGFGDGVDVGIEFCLAVRDPNGQPTTGIVRVNGSSVANYANQGIEASGGTGADEAAVKALSTWPRASYVNIWIVNEIEDNDAGAGIQGYAYFPVNSPVDGIVVLHNAFGTVGNLKTYTDMNRTLTHEVGHYLGLYHTFHSTSTCSSETACATQGDRVCDTPPTILNASCSSPACSGTQQVENYMDYTSETCQDMFTDGQKLRMRTTLETQRTSMLTSMGCMPVNDRDAGITAVLSPGGTSCSTSYSPEVTLTNFGNLTLTSVTIQYNIDGTGLSSYSWTGSLATGASATVTLPSITASLGDHTFYAWTANPNGQSDQNTANDQSTNTFTVSTGTTATLLVELDYFGAENTWEVTDENGTVMAYGGPYVNNQNGLDIYETICLPNGCYTLTFFDSYGDGQGFVNGDFTLFDEDNNILVFESGNWGAEVSNDFCLDGAPVGNPPVASFTIQDATACIGQQVDFTSTSTNAPTSYSWTFTGGSPSTSTQANPQNISWSAAGTYSISLTATNAFGSHTYTCTNCITVIAAPAVSLTTSNPLCATGTTGSITSTVTGGYGPYVYSWNTGATTSSLSNVGAGSYTVTATNQQGCTSQASATLSAPSAISIQGTVTPASCAGQASGSISVTATGGTGSKTFSWSNGASGATVSNIAAGTYTVTATDANGCTATQNFTVTAPSAINVQGTVTNAACFGQNNGSISVTATGGTGSKTFTWNTGATGATISNLAAGSYSVTATDANGCTTTQAFTVTAPASLVANLTETDILCTMTTGAAQVAPTGGTSPYTVSWSNGASGTSVNGLATGNYSVTVTDAQGCTASASFVITQSAGLAVGLSDVDVSCAGANDGSISASVTGGTAPFTYAWSNGGNSASISGLTAGSYSVVVTDSQGCSGNASVIITAPAAVNLAVFHTDMTCFGTADGSATATATGGSGSITYTWNTGASGNSINGLPAGTYTVTATDANGCSVQETILVVQPSQITATTSVLSVETCAGSDGSAVVNALGGTGALTVQWNTGATGVILENATAGEYTATITDSNGCSAEASVTISYDCTVILPTTQLLNTYCGAANLSLTDAVSCMAVPGASQYQWRFTNLSGFMLGEVTTAGTSFAVSAIPTIEPGMSVLVAVRAFVNDTWAPYGADCQISLDEVLGTTQLIDEDCGSVILGWGETIYAEELPGAQVYEWHFTGDQYEWTSFTTTNAFVLESSMVFAAGGTYDVQIRCGMGEGIFTEWGDICPITFDNAIDIIEPVDNGVNATATGGLILYPNPSDGSHLVLDFSNLSPDAGVDAFMIYNAAGQLVDVPSIRQGKPTKSRTLYTFESPLPTGMYFLVYTINGQPHEEKLIVR